MIVGGLLPGFRYVHSTDDPNRFVVIIKTKVFGLFTAVENQWVLDKRDGDSFITCRSEMLLKLPVIEAQRGTIEIAQEEVDRLYWAGLWGTED